MYGPPRPLQGPLEHFDDDSLRKCIRPLASGLLLQPGHDEIRARRFHISLFGHGARFSAKDLRHADRLSRHHSSSLAICRVASAEDGIDPFVERAWTRYDHPAVWAILAARATVTLLTCMLLCRR